MVGGGGGGSRGAGGDDESDSHVEDRREKALNAGAQLSAQLAAARADIAAAKDLAAGAAPATPAPPLTPAPAPSSSPVGGLYKLASPQPAVAHSSSTQQQHTAVHAHAGVENPEHLHELRDRLRAEHSELARLRGELATLRTNATSRDVEVEKYKLSEAATREDLTTFRSKFDAAAHVSDALTSENAALREKVAAAEETRAQSAGDVDAAAGERARVEKALEAELGELRADAEVARSRAAAELAAAKAEAQRLVGLCTSYI
jgi:hypothetical protein